MRHTHDGWWLSPSDLNHFVDCEHLTTLDMLAGMGAGVALTRDPYADILRAKGLEHERLWLERLRQEGRTVAVVVEGEVDWTRDQARTHEAMRAGVDVIYQGVFVDTPWRGIADFLVRVDTPSRLGGWSYEAWDTKLARRPRPSFILQLCWYTEQIARMQGEMPSRMHVVLGTGEALAYAPLDFLAYYHAVRGRFVRAMDTARVTYPLPVSHCHVCGYVDHCAARRAADDHVSLVAGVRRDQVERLMAAGIQTVAALARAEDRNLGIQPQTRERLVRQARLQTEVANRGHRYECLTPEPRRGFGLLPLPSMGDVFFDIEGYPYFETARGLEYLWGVQAHEDGEWRFRSFECVDRAGERRAFEQFIDYVHERLGRYPDMHVYHYAPYETSAIKRLMGDHATREAEVDDLLKRRVFVDLYQVVRQALQVSYDSYSLKKVRRFFMTPSSHGSVHDGGESILEFERFLDTGDLSILAAIRDYNALDCESTRRLRDWLLERKLEAEHLFGQTIPWATPPAAVEEVPDERDDTGDLRARLMVRAEASMRTSPNESRTAELLAALVDYHRREAKPGWWSFFDRLTKSLDELRDDAEAIAYLSPTADAPRQEKKSLVHSLAFPEQEFKLREGVKVREPIEGRPAGDLAWIRPDGTLGLKRGPTLFEVPLPKAVVAPGPVPDYAQRQSLARMAERLLTGARADAVGRALLARALPRVTGVEPGARLQSMDFADQEAVVGALESSYLFVQGPPGSGKTYAAARMIAGLLTRGSRVAVTATSHKAIHNLLDEVVVAGRARGLTVTGVKKSSGPGESEYDGPGFSNESDNGRVAASDAPLVAGTAWLFAREEMTGQFDYLFIDEAGQVALADAVAMSPCARNLVLLGDPQQLPHVTQAVHPHGSGVSVLEHLLGDELTIGPSRGLFLEQTWRMHPDVCRFVSTLAYGGRLRAHPDCARQRVDSAGVSGTGLRVLAVAHTGNAQQSTEEARVVAHEVDVLLRTGTFTDRTGATRQVTPSDVLVVAPYNMQVRALLDVLPQGVEAGTVDKFQGREAPVVFFSMATSSGEDIPRGLDFLFSRNRLNVAMSRAQALAVLVYSPQLLETRCRTVEQMRLVNGLCRFVDACGTPHDVGVT